MKISKIETFLVRWGDVAVPDTDAVRVRRAMEQRFAPPSAIAAQ